ncbi:hypothetical protein F2Q69_00008834 [Brassica cretica]|uniref:Uncharacterized protein n=1 Tax=Brassica cretica TaxID=69181 RepID=A0A8S9PG01_BRACR|nr:hypothetical protein F2Q69_00008834 [Brassica cretica]
MSSNGKFTLSGDPNSKKQRGVGADSFPGTNKSIGKHGGSSSLSIGDPHSKKSKGDVSVSSPGLNKPISTTGDSPGVPTGVSNSKKPNGPIVERTKTGVSSGVRGKAAVSSHMQHIPQRIHQLQEGISVRPITVILKQRECKFMVKLSAIRSCARVRDPAPVGRSSFTAGSPPHSETSLLLPSHFMDLARDVPTSLRLGRSSSRKLSTGCWAHSGYATSLHKVAPGHSGYLTPLHSPAPGHSGYLTPLHSPAPDHARIAMKCRAG